ncbi:MAG TPA: hybrid sensor histidine kinase/response regulator, partial [Polyangia bacterium]|nr:hybrid sensor histidine kinase/response regulator [Polyangia bacterium]
MMPAHDNPLPPPSLLIVDDHPANLLALETVLDSVGAQIVRAASGEDALKAMLRQEFALIIMDVHMEELDGYQTMQIIRQRERLRDVPVIFLTAHYSDPDELKRGFAVGAVDYITKPFDPEVLRAKVRALVALYGRGELAERARNSERDRMRDLFLGVVGHDLRNPLNAITVATQYMARDAAALPEAHRRVAITAAQAATRMERIIDDILDLTRINFGGGLPMTFAACDLNDICRAVVDELAVAHPSRRLQVQLDGDLRGR